MSYAETSRFIDIDGLTLHLREAGPASGEPVILLHGFPEHSGSWRKQTPALAEAGFRVIAVDMRGYGPSSSPAAVEAYHLDRLAADVVDLADALGLQRFNLVGHDWGGIVAWAVAAQHAMRITRLIILNAPHPDVMPVIMRQKPLQLLRSSYVGFFQLPWLPEALLTAGDFRLLKRALTSTARPGTFSQSDLSAYAAEWGREGRLRGMINYYRALVRLPRAPLGRIVQPTLILWGCQDQALDVALSKASLMQCSNGRMDSHRRATHWIHLEEPDWINERMLRYLAEERELDRPEPGLSSETR
jgi:epoxide hydrolase 4